jgi:hypothetical protein
MAGYDNQKFKDLAKETKLPCGGGVRPRRRRPGAASEWLYPARKAATLDLIEPWPCE